MLFDATITDEKDRVSVRLTPNGESWGAGFYLSLSPIKKAKQVNPLSLLFLTLSAAAHADAILREAALE